VKDPSTIKKTSQETIDSLLDKSINMNDLQETFKLLSEQKTTMRSKTGGDRVGTPYYLSPELWNNQQCSK
jgi:hypothetical protein